MPKPRIVSVSSYYPPALGGLENVAQEIAEQLAADGYPVTVLASDGGAKGMPRVETRGALTVRRLRSFTFAHVAFIPSLLWNLLTAPKPSIFHLHLSQAYTPEMVWLAAKLRGIPYVVHFHLDVEPSGLFGFIFMGWKRWVQPVIIRGAARVITLSPMQSALIKDRYGVPAEKVIFIGNGVGKPFLAIGAEERSFHDPLRLLFVGRLSKQKRVERLVGALEFVARPVELILVGDGEDRAALEQLARAKGLRNVAFKGALRGDALLAEYRAADAFVIASDREGMSLSILEAMAAGLPVVGSDALGIAEMVGGTGVLVPDPSARTFGAAIEELAAHRERLPALSEVSFKKAEQYSWEKLVSRLETEVYPSIQA